MFDAMDFRKCCGHFATGVTVVTAKLGNGELVGVTANSFASVSLDPPLVLFCLDKSAQSFDAFSLSSHFAFNFLGANQQGVSNNFATPGIDKFANAEFEFSEHGIPLLKGCIAQMECKMHAIHDGGDHQIIVGLVEDLNYSKADEAAPLVYFQGQYASLESK